MTHKGITWRLFMVGLLGGVCWIASMMVLGLVSEREGRQAEAMRDIATSWGARQTLMGPMLVSYPADREKERATFVFPKTLEVKSELVPEIRSRGIFDVPVYTSAVHVSGTFAKEDIAALRQKNGETMASVLLSDTRGIEEAVDLSFDGQSISFVPGSGVSVRDLSGFHVPVNAVGKGYGDVRFSFTVKLKGSEGFEVVPIGDESTIELRSPWATPKFVGEFLPRERSVSEKGFSATWKVSSFGRSSPRMWQEGEVVLDQLSRSSAGVDLFDAVAPYDPVVRSIKYAIIFIVVTFAAFFLFDVLSKVRVHPVSYLLIGSALALFSLLLLSFSEHIGFTPAYLLGACMTVLLVGGYARAVLGSFKKSLPIVMLLALLYGYLYFVLQLEDYALLFGSLLLFVFLAFLMYVTRRVDWFALDRE